MVSLDYTDEEGMDQDLAENGENYLGNKEYNVDSEVAEIAGLNLWQVQSTQSIEAKTNSELQLDTNIASCCCNNKSSCFSHGCDSKNKPTKEWLIDSGASLHYTNDLNDFVDYQELNTIEFVQTANSSARVLGQGTIILVLSTGEVVRIKPAYYIPALT